MGEGGGNNVWGREGGIMYGGGRGDNVWGREGE